MRALSLLRQVPARLFNSTTFRGLLALWLIALGSAGGGARIVAQQVSPREPAARSEGQDARLFGARGDGQADDTDALQQALDAGSGRIHLSKGIYRITRPLTVDLDRVGYTAIDGDGVATIRMEGAGAAIRFVGTHFKSAAPEGFEERVWKNQRMPQVVGLAIVGAHAEADGIEASGTMQLTLDRVHVRNARHAVHLVENNRNVIISNCHFYENSGVGIYYDDVNLHQSNIVGCHISYNDEGGIVSRRGNVRNIHIAGCDIESNMSPDTPATANVLIDCRDSTYGTAEVAISGCTIQHNHVSPSSANVRIIGRSDPPPMQDIVREGHVTITGNVFSDVQVNVHLQDCRGVVLTGNTFWMGYEHDLLVEDCSNIVIGSNNLDRNPRYDYGDTRKANNGVVIRNTEDSTISGLHINGAWRKEAGLQVVNCRRMNITGCTVLNCDNVGILLEDVHDSLVAHCLVRDSRPGATMKSLQVVGGSGNSIDANLLKGE